MEYVDTALYGPLYRRELRRLALEDMGWREDGTLAIIDGRRFQFKGLKKGVAIEGNFSAYEYILEDLFRLQLGFDMGRIAAGILMLTGQRSEKSSYGSSLQLAQTEVEQLYPTISLPVTVCSLFLSICCETHTTHCLLSSSSPPFHSSDYILAIDLSQKTRSPFGNQASSVETSQDPWLSAPRSLKV